MGMWGVLLLCGLAGGALLVCALVARVRRDIHRAAKSGNVARVVELLARNPKLVNRRASPHNSPLQKPLVVQMGPAKGHRVDASPALGGWTLLHYAALQGRKGMADVLLANGAEINAKWIRGATPLHVSASPNNKDLWELLIRKGADVNAKLVDGETVLHVAARLGLADLAGTLLSSGADPNARTDSGHTPLHLVGGEDLFTGILKAAWLERQTVGSFLAGIAAASQGRTAVVEVLLAGGADINAKDENGLTPLQLAAKTGRTDLVELLKRHHASE